MSFTPLPCLEGSKKEILTRIDLTTVNEIDSNLVYAGCKRLGITTVSPALARRVREDRRYFHVGTVRTACHSTRYRRYKIPARNRAVSVTSCQRCRYNRSSPQLILPFTQTSVLDHEPLRQIRIPAPIIWNIQTTQPQAIQSFTLISLPDGPIVGTTWRTRHLVVQECLD